MDKDGYPTKQELRLIKEWPCKDVFSLLEYIFIRWNYADAAIKGVWGKCKITDVPVYMVEMHTYGWSGNEDIIEALLANDMFNMLWYAKWERGGHYYFEIKPFNIGYKTVAEVAVEKNVSRQYIHKSSEKFDWIVAGKRNKLCRLK